MLSYSEHGICYFNCLCTLTQKPPCCLSFIAKKHSDHLTSQKEYLYIYYSLVAPNVVNMGVSYLSFYYLWWWDYYTNTI